jgi:hypothetical protein
MQEMFLRAASASDTLALSHNYAHEGVYVLHGDQDDNVPVGQARTMEKHLADFHRDWTYYEQPGAGHWWGNPCVDWPPMFEFFARHAARERKDIRQVSFASASPGVCAWCDWAGIEAQTKAWVRSSVNLHCDPDKRSFTGTTDNVARLALDLSHLPPDKQIQVELDGQKLLEIPWPKERSSIYVLQRGGRQSSYVIRLTRNGEKWSTMTGPPVGKGPERYGSFKDAFRNHVVFVYGTRGTPAENAWAYARARFDAEMFWYRGNASVEVMSDVGAKFAADRNVVLYGHSESNSLWKAFLADSPVQVKRGSVRIGEHEIKGDDLACLFIYPSRNDPRAAVGVIAGTGLPGMRLTEELPYFLSGVSYPDCTILRSSMLKKGIAGVECVGFFGNDWKVETGDFAWKEQQ